MHLSLQNVVDQFQATWRNVSNSLIHQADAAMQAVADAAPHYQLVIALASVVFVYVCLQAFNSPRNM